MEKRKVIMVLLAAFGFYLVGAGGVVPLVHSTDGVLSVLLDPLKKASPFDFGVLIVSMLLLSWAFLLGSAGEGLTRTDLYRGLALGSALVAGACLATTVTLAAEQPLEGLLGIAVLMAFLQGVVGLVATLFLHRAEHNWRMSSVPLVLNTSLCAAAVVLVGFAELA